MIKFHEIKTGDYLMADNDGDRRQGEVTDLNHNEKQVCVNTGTQDFWYETEQLSPIPLDDEQLMRLKFHKQEIRRHRKIYERSFQNYAGCKG